MSYWFVPLELVLGRFHGLDIPDQDFRGSMSVIRPLGAFEEHEILTLIEDVLFECFLSRSYLELQKNP